MRKKINSKLTKPVSLKNKGSTSSFSQHKSKLLSQNKLLFLLVLWLSLFQKGKCCIDYKQTDNNFLPYCPDGQYGDWLTCECRPCHPYCSRCTERFLQNCTHCKPDNSGPFNPSGYAGIFCHGCPATNQYRDIATDLCYDCDPSCVTCFGPGPGKCRSCPPGFQFPSNGYCYQICLTNLGFYNDLSGIGAGTIATGRSSDVTGFIGCKACHSSCRTCSGGTDRQCQTCHPGFFLYLSSCFAQVTPGINGCNPGFFFYIPTLTCEPCDPSCFTCTTQADRCLTCALPLKFNPIKLTCIDPLTEGCPIGYWNNPNTTICQPVSTNCISYSPTGVCTECGRGSLLQTNNLCTSTIWYNNYVVSNPMRIFPCHSSC